MVEGVVQELKHIRVQADTIFHEWFLQCEQLAGAAGVNPSAPRILARQRHARVQCSTLRCRGYRTAIFLPFVDHLMQEISIRFGPLQQKTATLFALVPSITGERESSKDCRAARDQLKEEWGEDIPCPTVLDVELMRWQRKWQSAQQERPDNLLTALKSRDRDMFPGVHLLLRLACATPVTFAKTKRAYRALKALKTKVRNSMTEGRLTSLSILKIRYFRPLDISRVVNTFASNNPRRMRVSFIE